MRRVFVGVIDILCELRLFLHDVCERLLDLRVEIVVLFRGGRGEQHLLRAARTQQITVRFFGRAVRDVALRVNGFGRAVQTADLRERNRADGKRPGEHEPEREPERCLDGQRAPRRVLVRMCFSRRGVGVRHEARVFCGA